MLSLQQHKPVPGPGQSRRFDRYGAVLDHGVGGVERDVELVVGGLTSQDSYPRTGSLKASSAS